MRNTDVGIAQPRKEEGIGTFNQRNYRRNDGNRKC